MLILKFFEKIWTFWNLSTKYFKTQVTQKCCPFRSICYGLWDRTCDIKLSFVTNYYYYMYVYIYVYIYIYIYIHAYIYISPYIYVYINTYIYIYIYLFVYIHTIIPTLFNIQCRIYIYQYIESHVWPNLVKCYLKSHDLKNLNF